MDLITDLPRDIALQCLIRVPFDQLHRFRSVCKAWKAEIELPELLRLRKSTNKAQSLVVLSQAYVNPTGNWKYLHIPVYRLVVFQPETGCWSEIPPLPEFSNGLPFFCQIATVGSNLVVMGGYDPESWECLESVFLFDFLSSTWHRGADMPGGPRSFFGCASDGDRTVFVAGGHDLHKNALTSAWTYNVATDNWSKLPDMAKERDECKVLFHIGKFHVMSGYPTDMQGGFYQSVEIFDMSAREWTESNDMFSHTIKSPKLCVEGTNGKMYTRHTNDVLVLEDDKWQFFARLPVDMASTPYLLAFDGHLMLLGASKYGEPNGAYTMDLNDRVWTKAHVPMEYTGHVQFGCCLTI
ncbi:hypothetical protein L1887_11104 [Cichorium endivia]|nr:hypothetical protein L1887_11104 [Cichorium endivia]